MKKIKLLCLMSVLLLSFVTATGCSGSQSLSSGNTGNSEDGQPDEGVSTISVMMLGTASDNYAKIYQEITDDFNASNSLNCKAELQLYENEQYKTKLTTLMASNSVPDVFFSWELGYLQPFVEGGKVLEIGPELDKDPEWKERYAEGVFGPVTFHDKIYGVPCAKSLSVMFYNKEIFNENQLEVPQTYEDFLNICEQLKQKRIIPMTLSAVDAWIPAQFIQQLAMGMGAFPDYEALLAGDGRWDTPAFTNAGLEAQSLIDKGYFQDGFLGMSAEEAAKFFQEGKAAMYFQGTWDLGTLANPELTQKADVIGAFGMPAKDPSNDNYYVGSINTILCASSSTKNVEAVCEYIKSYSTTESQEKLLYGVGFLPSTNLQIDEEKINSLTADVVKISGQAKGFSAWMDRAFGAGDGVEFNNKCQAIFGGNDPEQEFKSLQQYAEDNAD